MHADLGGYGYYPLIDRKIGYYLQIVAFESEGSYPFSGIPEYLGSAIKPVVDAIMTGEDVSNTAYHHNVGFNALGMTDVNYIMGCYADPKSCA